MPGALLDEATGWSILTFGRSSTAWTTALMLKAVARHTDQKWILLYVKRWLVAPLQQQDGTLDARDRGTPQGGLCSAEHNPPYEQRRVMRSAGR